MSSTDQNDNQEPVTDTELDESEVDESNPDNVIPLPRKDDLVRARVRVLLNEGIGQRSLARKIGVSDRSLIHWLNRERPARDTGRAVCRWLAKLQLASKGRSYVETPSGVKVQRTLRHAHDHGDFDIIHGGPGVGKTMATQRYVSERERAYLSTVDPTTSGLIPALETVAESLGLSDTVSGAKRLSALIRRKLGGFTDPALIIVDEAQHLSMSAVEALRAIHDSTGVGLVLMGNDTSYSRLVGGARSAHYAQIRSRIGVRTFVAKPSDADVAHLAAAWGVTDDACVAVLRDLAGRPGALRTAAKVLLLCAQSGTDITRDALLASARLYGAEV